MAEGIEETKDVLKFAIGLAEAIDKSMEDGKIGFADLFKFAPVLLDASAAFNGADNVIKELKDLSKEEREDLYRYVEEEFDIRNDKVEQMVEKALKAAFGLYGLVDNFKA